MVYPMHAIPVECLPGFSKSGFANEADQLRHVIFVFAMR